MWRLPSCIGNYAGSFARCNQLGLSIRRIQCTFTGCLRRYIYGSKQVSRSGQRIIRKFLVTSGFKTSFADQSLYCKSNLSIFLSFCVYGFMLSGSDERSVKLIIVTIATKFKVRSDEAEKKFPGIVLGRDPDGNMKIHSRPLIEKMVHEYHQNNGRKKHIPLPENLWPCGTHDEAQKRSLSKDCMKTYQQLVGSMLQMSNTRRPDVCFTARFLSRHMQSPTTVN